MFTAAELMVISAALALAETSAIRLANRVGQSDEVKVAHGRHAEAIVVVQSKVRAEIAKSAAGRKP